jgi:hypothetical protein
MATRSDIIVQISPTYFKRVYCHWDGYLEGVGKTLLDHYNSQERAEALLDEGAISSLDARCDKPYGHSFSSPIPGYTVYYGRDRGDKEWDAKRYQSLNDALDDLNEYTYVFRDGQWFYSNGNKNLRPLTEDVVKKAFAES